MTDGSKGIRDEPPQAHPPMGQSALGGPYAAGAVGGSGRFPSHGPTGEGGQRA